MTDFNLDALTHRLHVDTTAWISGDSTLVGRVSVGPESSVWYRTVIRADGEPVEIGARTNIQDGCVLHTDPGHPIHIGDDVSVGHAAVLHGCEIHDCVLVGMGAVIMNGASLRPGVVVAAGAVVLEGTEAPDNAVLAGVPARIIAHDESNRARNVTNAETYRALARLHARLERS